MSQLAKLCNLATADKTRILLSHDSVKDISLKSTKQNHGESQDLHIIIALLAADFRLLQSNRF